MRDRDLSVDTLARTLYGEARGEGLIGMEAVASVVMNRLALSEQKNGYWWGDSIVDICQKPFQFSCWNANDPNRSKLLAVDPSDRIFAAALDIAGDAVDGKLKDPTGGATSYCTTVTHPDWAKEMVQTIIIRNHVFYRLADS